MQYDSFMAKNENSKKQILSTKSLKIVITTIAVAVLVIAPSIYFYLKYDQSQKLLQNQPEVRNQKLVGIVAKLIELPKNETPTIATVSDKTKLEKNSFYNNAENGDKVLIYSKARKAILYRPSTNKIIDVAPINLNTATAESSPTVSPASSSSPTLAVKPKTVSLLILNGTKTAGLASTAKKEIGGEMTTISDISIGDSVNNYTKTVIVDSSGNKQIDDQLVNLVGGTVVKVLPQGEKAAKQDIIIILGADFK
jgi:hypothetical protein